MAGPQIYFTAPKYGLIPDGRPAALPPPVGERSFRSPFGIDPDLFHFVLRPEVPIVIAATYIVTVFFVNAYNRERQAKNKGVPKPWWIARQAAFQYFVVAHNALLILYSAATFLAMLRAAIHTWPGYSHDNGLAGLADAYCKMLGPRGLGDAVSYNTTINIWESKNYLIKLGSNGSPDPTDVGRLWNEGLAFWGWFFYVSKFYEVLDTLVILAKGKRSPTLQTYHHSGAMLCMWAGIRYMSPPIWMFVFVNSFIHTLMYTYFTLSALEIKVPVALKRTLTTMQIIQLIWGSLYAGGHLFLQYDMPVTSSYQIENIVKAAVSSVSSVASVVTSTVSDIIETPTPTGDMVALAKKLLLRAVGEEGIAELVTNKYGHPLAPAIEKKIEQFNEHFTKSYETQWRSDMTKVDCLDTSGEAFAIYLNLLYLTPLTFLFLRFFIKAYTDRGKPRTASEAAKRTVPAGKEAGQKTNDKVEALGKRAEDEVRKLDASGIQEQVAKDLQALKEGTLERGRKLSSEARNFGSEVKAAADKALKQGQSATEKTVEQSKALGSETKDAAEKAVQQGQATAGKAVEQGKDVVEKAAEQGQDAAKKAAQQGQELLDSAAQKTSTKKPVVASESPSAATEGSAAVAKEEKPVADDENKENQPPSSDEPAAVQDAILATTKDTRPGVVAEEEGNLSASKIEDEDTDAMGKSGAIVDLVAEKAEEAAEAAKETVEEVKEAVEAKAEEAKES